MRLAEAPQINQPYLRAKNAESEFFRKNSDSPHEHEKRQKGTRTMDFSQWSPSHTVLIFFMVLGFVGQIAILFYRTARLEKRADKTHARIDRLIERIDTRGERLEQRIDTRGERLKQQIERQGERLEQRIDRGIEEVRVEIRDVRLELSKLNQNHIDHLTHHALNPDPQ